MSNDIIAGMNHNLQSTILELGHVVSRLEHRAMFRSAVSGEALSAFEMECQIRLPSSYKTFLMTFDGGFIYHRPISDVSPANAAWNSNRLLGLDDIRKEYVNQRDIMRSTYGVTQWPFIPMCRTKNQELLVFGQPLGHEGENSIVDAFHELPPTEWRIIYSNFGELLRDYVAKEGDIKTIAASQ